MSHSNPPSRRARRMSGPTLTVLVSLAAVLEGAAFGAFVALKGDRTLPLPIALTLAATTVILIYAMCLLWWRGLDEAAREAHKWAWYWGGTNGLVVLMAALVVLATSDVLGVDRVSALWSGKSASALVSLGLGLALGVQIAGYAAAWVFWWIRRR